MAAGEGGKALGVATSNPTLDGLKVPSVFEAGGDGTSLKAAFFGVTPVVRPTSTLQAAAASTAPVSISATQWAFASSAQAQAVLTLVNQLRAELVTLGLITGS